MLQVSNPAKLMCGVTLIAVPVIEYAGVSLLKMFLMREPGYMEYSSRRRLTRAGHAHAGVLLILSLICQVLVDSAELPPGLSWLVRIAVPASAILIPLGFNLSTGSPPSDQPEGGVQLAFCGDFILAVSLLVLATGLVNAAVHGL